ncbi:hypothetical protein [Knoellia subterranea]|uniref:Uncharacterized protein n=1 Tax=Knoellia subterranea KCTC 19937 TaxID=1385521 RepID=A0A0A0JNG1_9MICO|nr:hypothetical protein [Knoellia subterranea]KGN37567.1 hypothetical protein N803_13540 [Knoellia subterranea KCTC 19937]
MSLGVGAGAALLSVLFGLWATRWLDSRAYRYEDESDIRLRTHSWVPFVLPLAVTAVAIGQTYAVGVAAGVVDRLGTQLREPRRDDFGEPLDSARHELTRGELLLESRLGGIHVLRVPRLDHWDSSGRRVRCIRIRR